MAGKILDEGRNELVGADNILTYTHVFGSLNFTTEHSFNSQQGVYTGS